MVRGFAVSMLVALWAQAALADSAAPPTENVTVTGTKSREVIRDFVKSLVTPTHTIGKIARWETGICPITVGVQPAGNDFVTARVKQIAARVGAPVSENPACKHNIEIVFTRTPQALLDNVKKNQSNFLGYYDSQEQRDRLATITRPLQAWYTTATQDLHGVTQVDSSGNTIPGLGLQLMLPCVMMGEPGGPDKICVRYLPYAIKANVSGSRIGDGLRSDFYNIIIVADLSKLGQQELDAISDYIAMLALAQPPVRDDCPPLPSIMSLLAAGCASHAGRLTDNDMGFLKALYAVNPEREGNIQKELIADRMEQNAQ